MRAWGCLGGGGGGGGGVARHRTAACRSPSATLESSPRRPHLADKGRRNDKFRALNVQQMSSLPTRLSFTNVTEADAYTSMRAHAFARIYVLIPLGH